MASDTWSERLEAYLDGELDHEAAAAFAAETAASAPLRAELEARRGFRALARRVLRDEEAPAPRIGSPRAVHGVRGRVWTAAAVAAAALLLLLAPPLARRLTPTSPPRAPEIRAGQVVAIRFGEIPNATVTIETGCYDHAMDTVR